MQAVERGHKWQAGWWFTLAALFLFCCLQAGSRRAWLSVLAFGVAYAICETAGRKQWLKNSRQSWLPFLGLGGVIVALFWMEPHLRDRLNSLLAMQSSYRLETWEIIIGRFVERPFFGHGINTQLF